MAIEGEPLHARKKETGGYSGGPLHARKKEMWL